MSKPNDPLVQLQFSFELSIAKKKKRPPRKAWPWLGNLTNLVISLCVVAFSGR